jgi:leader peptidase (prepilin peptidase)/N-methyltransferase
MPWDLPRGFELAWWTVVGLFVGSFLNVCIHRLPKPGASVWSPRRSHCPSCSRQLTWRENVPLVSWAIQLGRCRGCGWGIPWRYPLVEALTAGVWLWTAWWTPQGDWPLLLVRLTVVSGLLVATFVDFDCFEIPDEVSIGGMVLAPLAALGVPSLHASTWLALLASDGGASAGSVDRIGALLGSLAGMAVGGGILLAIGWVGRRIWGREAMGLGDVKLLAAGGGFVGPGGALFALIAGSVLASVVGLANMARFFALSRARNRQRGGRKSLARSLATARVAGRYLPFGPYLALGIGIALLHWNHVQHWL